MKKAALFFAFVCAAGSISAQSDKNLNFENWVTNANGKLVPANWTLSTDEGIIQAPGHTGSGYALGVKAEQGVTKTVEIDHLPFEEGKRYVGKAYVKNTSSIAKGLVSALLNYEDMEDYEGYSFYIETAPDWKVYDDQYIDFTIPDGNSAPDPNYRIRLTFEYNAAGTGTDDVIYVDDISFWQYGTMSAAQADAVKSDVQLESSVVSTELKLLAKGETEATVYDASSKKIASQKGNGNLTFNVSGWPKGVYFMNIVNRGVIVQKKFIVK